MTTAVTVLVAPAVALATGVVVEPRVGVSEGVDDAGEVEVGDGVEVLVAVGEGVEVEVGDGVEVVVVVGVGVEVVVVVGVGVSVGVGDGVEVVVVVGVDVSVKARVCFATEFAANDTVAAMAWGLATTTIVPISENNNNVEANTPTIILPGVSLVQIVLSERRTLREPASRLFFILHSSTGQWRHLSHQAHSMMYVYAFLKLFTLSVYDGDISS